MSPSESSPPHPRRLILMRHAKSDWADPARSDHHRPLNKRGRRDAPRMADWLTEIGGVPELIVCSSAERTQETAALMNATWSHAVPVCVSRELYLAPPESILRVIHSDGCGADPLMVIGHNPGLAELISRLAGRALEVPTAAVALFEAVVNDWEQLRSADQVELRAWMQPKKLPDS